MRQNSVIWCLLWVNKLNMVSLEKKGERTKKIKLAAFKDIWGNEAEGQSSGSNAWSLKVGGYDPIRGCIIEHGGYKNFGNSKRFLNVQRPKINSTTNK